MQFEPKNSWRGTNVAKALFSSGDPNGDGFATLACDAEINSGLDISSDSRLMALYQLAEGLPPNTRRTAIAQFLLKDREGTLDLPTSSEIAGWIDWRKPSLRLRTSEFDQTATQADQMARRRRPGSFAWFRRARPDLNPEAADLEQSWCDWQVETRRKIQEGRRKPCDLCPTIEDFEARRPDLNPTKDLVPPKPVKSFQEFQYEQYLKSIGQAPPKPVAVHDPFQSPAESIDSLLTPEEKTALFAELEAKGQGAMSTKDVKRWLRGHKAQLAALAAMAEDA
jgi:hypothetical protein